jgi:methoxymalonate biosynthesis acyl carrier protein
MVLEILPRSRVPGDLRDDDPLAAIGMDSMHLMMLISSLQRQFGITVDDEDLLEENFASLAAMASLVMRKGGA